MNQTSLEIEAHRRVRRLVAFSIHATIYVVVNIVLIASNLIFSPQRFWALGPLLGWGAGLAMHGLTCLRFNIGFYDWLYRREMRKLENDRERN
jgi:2TM domain